jgi:hypothetical protein
VRVRTKLVAIVGAVTFGVLGLQGVASAHDYPGPVHFHHHHHFVISFFDHGKGGFQLTGKG